MSQRRPVGSLLLLLAGTILSQPAFPQRPPTDSSVHTGHLANGLTYYVQRNDHPAHRAELRLIVRAGSVLEDDDQRGLAHLLEHMAFNGSTHFPGHAMWTYFGRVGMTIGADVNATTTADETIYKLTIPTDSDSVVANALEILEDWAHNLTIDSLEVERERRVVLEEWRARRGVGARISDAQWPVLFHGTRYAQRQPIGFVPVLESATASAVRRFYQDWYRPEAMAVVVVGDIDPELMVARVRRRFEGIRSLRPPRARPPYTMAGTQIAPAISVFTDSEAQASAVTLAYRFPTRIVSADSDFRWLLSIELFTSMLSTRFTKLARQPDAPFMAATSTFETPVRAFDVFRLDATVPDGRVPRAVAALGAELAHVERDGFTPQEFARISGEVLRIHRAASLGHQTESAVLAAGLVEADLSGTPVIATSDQGALQGALVARLLPTISLAEVNALAAPLTPAANRVILASAPVSATAPPPTASDLLGAVTTSMALPPSGDTATDGPLVDHEPTPGIVVAHTRIDTLDLDQWTFANGVRVILKRTAFNRDELILAGFRDGGLSLAADTELVPAMTALPMVAKSGIGRYDQASLLKRLHAIGAHMSMSMAPYNESIAISGSPRDAATLFELTYAAMTEPRLDSVVFRQGQTELRETVAHRQSDPGAALSDTVALLMAAHSPRVRLLNDDYVRQMDRTKSLAFVKRRFGDATGFTFIIVGAFDPDSIKPLIERYIGGLPTTGRPHTWRDTGERPPDGIVTSVVRKGREQSATSVCIFLGSTDLSLSDQAAVLALTSVLRHRLWSRLREQMTGVYSVDVHNEFNAAPVPRSAITVQFTADPRRLRELTAAMLAEVRTLDRDGPTPEEMQQFRAEVRRAFETEGQKNNYWLQSIMLFDQRRWKLTDILAQDALILGMTTNQIRSAAVRLLNPSHMVHVSLEPELPPGS